MTIFTPLAVICILALQGYAQAQCPEKNGRFAIPGQCDAYIECVDGVGEEKLCPDGLLFNDKVSPFTFPCQYPIDVSCENRAKLQPAQATEECPHQYGYYRIGDSKNCGQFMNCAAGRSFVFNCPEGLAYNQDTYRCDWPDQVPDCDAEAFLGFSCPQEAKSELLGEQGFNFFRSPHDCQHYYICIEGKPRMYNCGEEFAFNELINSCDGIENVTGCATGGSSFQKTPQLSSKPLRGSYAQCTGNNTRFPAEGQCDAYIECVNGVAEEKLCPDGLLFKEDSLECAFAPSILCGPRAKLQPPQGTDKCPRQFGFYKIGDASHCGQYMNCAHGVGKLTKCPEGLAFNKDTYRCDWPDETPDCDAEAFLEFTCPTREHPVDQTETEDPADEVEHYPHASDCKRYYVCVNDRPRLYRCAKFLVFNPESKLCDSYTNVPTCNVHNLPESRAIAAAERLRAITEENISKLLVNA